MLTMFIGSASCGSLQSIKLFTFGCTLAVVLMIFQYEHKLRLFNSPRTILNLPSLTLISVCGVGAAFVGFLYPIVISTLDRTSLLKHNNDLIRKSEVCKSLVIFLGINHLCVKIPFRSDLHFTLTLAFFCLAFWWWFDRSFINFIFSTIIALTLTMTIEILLRSGALQYSNSDFYLKTCVPCLTFAGAILTIQLSRLLSQPMQPLSSTPEITTEQEHPKKD